MRKRFMTAAALVLGVCVLSGTLGCGNDGSGDGAGGGELASCGDGDLDDGEGCDDGNLVDEDACLGTCQRNVCGDGFVDPAVEACDILPSATCQSLGFTGGTITCTDTCTHDTSACTGQGGPIATPTPAATATPGLPTATPTDGGVPVPTATPGSGGTTCDAGGTVAVTVAIDSAYGAARIDLAYPAADLNLPGSGTATSVVDRVEFATSGGLTTVNDDDNTGTLTASLVGFTEQPAGTFMTVTFDCVSGALDAGAFTCSVVSASTPGGVAIPDAGCTVAIP